MLTAKPFCYPYTYFTAHPYVWLSVRLKIRPFRRKICHCLALEYLLHSTLPYEITIHTQRQPYKTK
jgi:hypothetical protein